MSPRNMAYMFFSLSHKIQIGMAKSTDLYGEISLLLKANISQKLTQPSEGISYPVGDLCSRFTKRTLPSAFTLHSNPISPTDGTNGFL